MKKIIIPLAFLLASLLPVFAVANENVHLDHAPIDPSDQASLQRGAKVFVNYCLTCHSAAYMRYNRLQDIGLTDAQIKTNLLLAGEKVGETMIATMTKKDATQWFGAAPPDLSVEARARGADWLYSYLRGFYRDDTRPTGWNNTVFDNVAMPHVLWQLQGEQVLKVQESRKAKEQKDGHDLKTQTHALMLSKPGSLTAAEYDVLVTDLVNYMAYMAEPAQNKRKQLGWIVLLYLGLLFVSAYFLKKEFWKDIH